MPLYGQVVIGAPGAGKSTYCNAMRQFLQALPRPCACVNLGKFTNLLQFNALSDPANDLLPYDCEVDVCRLVNVAEVMDKMRLGPNGALMFAMDYLESKLDWLRDELDRLEAANSRTYLLIDLPGQIELFTHHSAVKTLLSTLTQQWRHRLVCVYLVDG